MNCKEEGSWRVAEQAVYSFGQSEPPAAGIHIRAPGEGRGQDLLFDGPRRTLSSPSLRQFDHPPDLKAHDLPLATPVGVPTAWINAGHQDVYMGDTMLSGPAPPQIADMSANLAEQYFDRGMWRQVAGRFASQSALGLVAALANRPPEEASSPTRLWNVATQCLEGGTNHDYMALSYVWSQYSHKKEYLDVLKEIAQITNISHAWIDALCINQKDSAEVASEMSKMGIYYREAIVTVVLAPDLHMPDAIICLANMKVYNESDTVWLRWAGQRIKGCMWAQRAWTLQEAAYSANVLILGREHIFSGTDFVNILNAGGIMGEMGSEPVSCSASTGADGEGLGQFLVQTKRKRKYVAETRWLGIHRDVYYGWECEVQKYECITDCWRVAGPRWCRDAADQVYGYLGLLIGGEGVCIKLGVSLEEALELAAAAGVVSSKIMDSAPSSTVGKCWQPRLPAAGTPMAGTVGGAAYNPLTLEKGMARVNGMVTKAQVFQGLTETRLLITDWAGKDIMSSLTGGMGVATLRLLPQGPCTCLIVPSRTNPMRAIMVIVGTPVGRTTFRRVAGAEAIPNRAFECDDTQRWLVA